MTPRTHTLWARVLLAVFVVAGLAWVLRLDMGKKVSTDIMDLLPAQDRRPEMGIIRSLAAEKQGRVVLLALTAPAGGEAALAPATERFVASLRGSGQFEEVVALASPELREGLGRGLFERRLDQLFPQWLDRQLALRAGEGVATGESSSRWLARRAASDLESFLGRGEAIALQELVPQDPLLLLSGLMDKVSASGLAMFNGGKPGLVWALQKGYPLESEGQGPVFVAIEQARREAEALAPGLGLEWTGVARFAARSRERIEAELSLLNTLSLAAVVAVCVLFLSRVTRVVHLVPPILVGLLGAWVVTTLAFDRVHVLVFVIGALLGGVAVDYGVYLYLQPPAYPLEPYIGKVRRLIKPLVASALTTVLGFSLLLASELPLIRQLGVFVGSGLLFALAGALLWFAQLRDFHLPARALVSRRLPDTRVTRGLALGAAVLVLLVAVGGPFLLQWRDEIRELEVPAPELRASDAAVRGHFGEDAGRTVYLTRGDTPAAAREAWGRFAAWHDERHPEAPLLSLAVLVPTAAQWKALSARRSELADFESELRAALEARSFDPAAFEPFFEAWRAWLARPLPAYDALVSQGLGGLRGPLSLMSSTKPGQSLYVGIARHPFAGEPPEGFDTLSTEQLITLNKVFGDYRQSALWLSLVGLGLLGLSVLVMYGVARGLRVFAIPLISCFFCFGLLGLLGQTLNLFHLLGAFLGVCLSHNYAIFTTENVLRGDDAPPSIRLSALSTAASFGALAFSRIPVVSGLGSSVSLIVLMALAIVELMPLLQGRRIGATVG